MVDPGRKDRERRMLPDRDKLNDAAPELYEALVRLLRELPFKRDWLDPVTEDFAKYAVAKAEGRK